MNNDEIEFDSDDVEQEYTMAQAKAQAAAAAAAANRRRLQKKRPAREAIDDEDEEEEEFLEKNDIVEIDEDDDLWTNLRGEEAVSRSHSHGSRSSTVAKTNGAGSSRTAALLSALAPRDDDEDQQDEIDAPTFRPETMHAIFKGVWTDSGTRSSKEALQLSAEYLRLFTIEALHRTAAYQRDQEDEELRNDEILIELDSLEAITPQLVMDF